MLFSSATTFITLLVSSPFIVHARHHHHNGALTDDFIMRQTADYTNGSLPIYSADGKVAYRFMKNMHDRSNRQSTAILMTESFDTLFVLNSGNDACAFKTTYTEIPAQESRDIFDRQFEIYPHGAFKDDWRFNYRNATGHTLNYMFVRNYWNKEGKIYKEVNGGHALRVAEIRNQRRHDPWLQTHHGVDTYTVSCRPDAPKAELVTLLALVLGRSITFFHLLSFQSGSLHSLLQHTS
ncbi:hypothetical protein H4Q26_010434 [Puccinia striiformis f. sp. tritici PST-130]|nr:hypothetical protein H4Q26_010434 [Puccinia striiformis f. sp. tritici PST-130]